MEILKTVVRCFGWTALIVSAIQASAGNSLLFLVGLFLFLAFFPLLSEQTKKSKSRFEAEFTLATGIALGTLFLLGAILPENIDQSKLVSMIIIALGLRLISFPVYN